MKLRQKLAVALASAMVITAVPVVTMAASTNSLTKETLKVAKNTLSTENAVKVNFKDNNGEKEVFYLTLTNAEWNEAEIAKFNAANTGVVSYEKQNPTTVKVTVEAGQATTQILPILANVKTGDATVEIVTMGGNTTVSKGSFVFATTSDAKVDVTVGTEVPSLYTTGTIADIVITETMTGAFKNLSDNEIELEIENSDFKFVNKGTVTFEYGFSGHNNSFDLDNIEINKDVMTIKLPADLKADGMGQIRISGIEVAATTKAPETGDLTISVYGKATETKTAVKVADITSYGSKIEIDEKDAVEVKAGEKKVVKFTLAETEKTSFVGGREVEFVLDKGYIMPQSVDSNNKYDEQATKTDLARLVKLENGSTTLSITDVNVEDKKVIGFTATMEADNTKVDEIKVEMPVIAGLEEEGDVTVTISGRSLEKELSAVITKINKGFTVDTQDAVLKVGLQGQTAGKITIKEADKAMLNSAKEIEITIPKSTGIKLTTAPTVKVVEGDIKVGKAEIDNSGSEVAIVTIPVQRASRTASTIEIADFGFTTDRTVAEGAFDVTIGGEALSKEDQTIELEKFLVVGTPNTEDLSASNGLAKGTATFVIGEATYTTNGTTKAMDAQSYIQDPGFTMIPVRYVAEAFGVKANDILFSNGTATIFAGNRTIQLTAGSDIAVVNGAAIKMGTKVVVKEGRTYAPVGEIARILGISTKWDSATKTATFENK